MRKALTTSFLSGALLLGGLSNAGAADVTLRFGHLWPAVAGPHTQLLEPWGKAVQESSGGAIEVQVFPSATLAKPPAQYEAVKSGIMDVTATILGYSANRFPLTQVVELPGLAKDAKHGSCIVQSLYDEGLLDSEFTDTKPLFLYTHGPGLLHTSEKVIQEPGDLAGLRIRRPTTVVATLLENLGAQPVGMPAPESYPSMQRGVIDGVAFPWEGALSFRLNELAKAHTEVGGLYTLTFIVTMNKGVYEGLSDAQKAAINANAGDAWSQKAGVLFDELDVKGRQQAVDAGHTIVTIEGGIENPAWKAPLAEVTQGYIDELQAKGLPGKAVYARALELAKTCQ